MLVMTMRGGRGSGNDGSSGRRYSNKNVVELHFLTSGRGSRYMLKEWRRVYRRPSENNTQLTYSPWLLDELLVPEYE